MARRRRVSKRVCAIRRARALDGSAFFKWYLFNSMFLFHFLSFLVFVLILIMIVELNVCVCSETCGFSVAIALADMHYCDSNKIQFKRLLGIVPKRTRPNIQGLMKSQPISPYRLFM
jgi:hypothetical protein